MSDHSIVTVLGAGASASGGYPLARDLFPKLEQFGNTLGDDHKLMRIAIGHVIAQARELDCLTPDDLALQAHQRRAGGRAQLPRFAANVSVRKDRDRSILFAFGEAGL